MSLSHIFNADRPEMVLLAPNAPDNSDAFSQVSVAPAIHEQLLSETQRLRGRIYLEDGAIHPEQLLADGRHEQSVDYRSWHVLIVSSGRVSACARYLPHWETVTYDELGVRRSALASSAYGPLLRDALESKLREAKRRNIQFVEVGGWALAPEIRCSPAAINMALMTFVLAEQLGGCLGITTATVRHCSASILQRIGGRYLEADGIPLEAYYDPQYGCEMALLYFDSMQPNPKYRPRIEALGQQIQSVPVICAEGAQMKSLSTELKPPTPAGRRVRPEAAA